jgi:hypothetical protein
MRFFSRRIGLAIAATVVIGAIALLTIQSDPPVVRGEYLGMADASAGVALEGSLFVAADDEVNSLCVYDSRKPGAPLATFDLSPYLKLARKSPEVDIEAATKFDQRVYWLSSHGTSKNGKERLNRRRLFATDFQVREGQVSMKFIGEPYTRLVDDLAAAPELAKYDFAAKARLAPKTQGGLNIEGLATSPTGDLLIGFRSPLYHKRAIVIPLTNGEQVVEGKRAKFGRPIELDLNGLGIRGIEYIRQRKQYVIVAGPQAAGECRLFTWSGNADDPPAPLNRVDLGTLNPEACLPNESGEVQLLSDDGVKESTTEEPTFRIGWVTF